MQGAEMIQARVDAENSRTEGPSQAPVQSHAIRFKRHQVPLWLRGGLEQAFRAPLRHRPDKSTEAAAFGIAMDTDFPNSSGWGC